jgi:hypothetical protein
MSAIVVTDASDLERERERAVDDLFGIDLGVQEQRLEVVDPIVVSGPPPTKRPHRTLTDLLAEAAADRARWGRSACESRRTATR